MPAESGVGRMGAMMDMGKREMAREALKPEGDVPATPSEQVQLAMQAALNVLNENRSRGRNWAVTLTEMEKVFAYFVVYASQQ